MRDGKKEEWKIATTEDWFDDAFSDPEGKWIWCPPPCLAKIAVEQLCEVKYVLPDSQHIFICPALMTGYWRKKLGKLVDTMFSLKAGCFVWPTGMFESLTIAFVKSFLPQPPWKFRHLPTMAG